MTSKYIVVFKDNVSKDRVTEHAQTLESNGGQITDRYESLLNGFTAVIPDSYLSSFQSFHQGEIDYIERDGTVTTQ